MLELLTNPEARKRFVASTPDANKTFKHDYENLLIVRLEDVKQYVNLPLPTTRTANMMLWFISDGHARLIAGDHDLVLNAGNLLFINTRQPVGITWLHEAVKGYFLTISDKTVSHSINDRVTTLFWPNIALLTLDHEESDIIDLNLKLIMHQYEKNMGITSHQRNLTALILSQLEHKIGSSRSQLPHLVERFMASARSSVKEQKSVTTFASELGVSPNHLNKIVRSSTGHTASYWLQQYRLEAIKTEVERGDATIKSLSMTWQLEPSYLSRWFLKMTGQKISELQRKID